MTPEIEAAFAALTQEYGPGALDRVERMLEPGGTERQPLQEKARWVLPGISPRPWHDPYEHPEIKPLVDALETHHGAISAELATAWADRRAMFGDYEHYLQRQTDWQALYLFRDGATVPSSEDAVPTTARILREHAIEPGLLSPLLECHFSTLLPGAAIAPHCDLWNFTINLHLAVDIPEGCGIRVAEETRAWEQGRCLLFDYSFEHEAWNHGTAPRTCLLMDLWHPETTVCERRALTVLVTEVRKLMGESS
ncbi:aspartyl/asparaginyl beta-hydroxylase domain-containing protein [Streptomyces sp. GSL17-111]|uniref:aspartyl/asparaginyl beta-hydroxylase domain-containing protein n=1 Tax=Streptomyces sp. GSL17-111 TaxID=3121596 RepID=UPI0030F4AAAC